MTITRTLKTALRALRRNIMRAVLTTLGIMIGIGAVIAMSNIGNGASEMIKRTVASMGANMFLIFPGDASSRGVSAGSGTNMTLTEQDCEAIIRECPAVRAAAPLVRARGQVVYSNRNHRPDDIYGTTPDYFDVREWRNLAEGELFTDRDVRNASKVCVIGQTVAESLFPDESPVGKEIRIANVAFTVVGVLRSKGANAWGSDQDDVVLAPWTSIKTRVSGSPVSNLPAPSASGGGNQQNSLSNLYPTSEVELYPPPSPTQQLNSPMQTRFASIDRIMAAASSSEQIPVAMEQIATLLRQRHQLRPSEPDDFNIRDMSEITRVQTEQTKMMTTLLLSVALISLIVGGVGIMNIMLVSVTERTREIGLRMAVGARGRDILWQFLVEALVLCLIGGIIGILLGALSSLLVTKFLNWPTQSSPAAIVVAVLVSAGVGLGFGFYPAWKASRLDPIEALRYE
jgi:ABC-type antimicrobial peptide transport system permease subunit